MPTARIWRALPYGAVIAVAAYFYHLAATLDFDRQEGRLGPDAWPKGMLALMMIAAVIGIVRTLSGARIAGPATGDHAPIEGDEIDEPQQKWLHLPILGGLLLALYVPLLEWTGFVIATSTLVAAFLYLGRYRNHLVIWVTAIAGPLAFFVIFRTVAYISLPLGEGPFLDFSVFLMQILGMT